MQSLMPLFDAAEALAFVVQWMIALVVIIGLVYIVFLGIRWVAYWVYVRVQQAFTWHPPTN